MKGLLAGRKFAFTRSIVLPTDRGVVVLHRAHRDALLHGAHRCAKVTPDARFLDDLHDRPAVVTRQPPDRLMRPILACRPTQLTLDAFVLIDVLDGMRGWGASSDPEVAA